MVVSGPSTQGMDNICSRGETKRFKTPLLLLLILLGGLTECREASHPNKNWRIRQDSNLQPSDPKLIFGAYRQVSSGITNRLKPIDFIGQSAVSGSAPKAYQNWPGAAQIAAQPV